MSAATKTPPPPRTVPGSHNPTFETENPLVVWFRENRGFVLLLIAAVVVGGLFNYFYPRYRSQDRMASWELYSSVTSELAQDFTEEDLRASLAKTRGDERVHPWVVLRASQVALTNSNAPAMAVLVSELETLESEGALAGVMVPTPDGPREVVPYVRERLTTQAGLAGNLVFTLPEPDGPRVRMVLTNAGTDTYDIIIGLYSEASPAAAAAFQAAVEEGRLVGAQATRSGGFALRFAGMLPEGVAAADAEGIPLEAQWGYFHEAGTLSLAKKLGAQSEQDPDTFDLLIADAMHLDGTTTLFGRVVEGKESLEELALVPGGEDPLRELEITSIEVLP